ncbi:MAG: hypothetical protein WAN05_05405, partial [Roseiarcus sp.]
MTRTESMAIAAARQSALSTAAGVAASPALRAATVVIGPLSLFALPLLLRRRAGTQVDRFELLSGYAVRSSALPSPPA